MTPTTDARPVSEETDVGDKTDARVLAIKLWLDRKYNRHHEMEDIEAGNFLMELLEARARIASLEKDAGRLDWLLADNSRGQAIRVQGSDQRGWSVIDMSDGVRILARAPTPRVAIDAAMKEGG